MTCAALAPSLWHISCRRQLPPLPPPPDLPHFHHYLLRRKKIKAGKGTLKIGPPAKRTSFMYLICIRLQAWLLLLLLLLELVLSRPLVLCTSVSVRRVPVSVQEKGGREIDACVSDWKDTIEPQGPEDECPICLPDWLGAVTNCMLGLTCACACVQGTSRPCYFVVCVRMCVCALSMCA
jgi:hypothetical protein